MIENLVFIQIFFRKIKILNFVQNLACPSEKFDLSEKIWTKTNFRTYVLILKLEFWSKILNSIEFLSK